MKFESLTLAALSSHSCWPLISFCSNRRQIAKNFSGKTGESQSPVHTTLSRQFSTSKISENIHLLVVEQPKEQTANMDSKSVRYDQLPLEEGSSPSETRRTTSTTRRIIQGVLCATVLASIITGTFWVWSHKHPHLPQYIDCGSSVEEALSKNCVMEPMIYGWIPRECYFADLSSQYSPFEDREWYTDDTFTVQIPPADLWAGKNKHAFTHKYHSTHCFFLWRKLALGIARRADYLDDKSLDLEHSDHCSEVLDHYGGETNNSTNDVVMGFHRCKRLAWV